MWNYRGQQRPAFADPPSAGQESVWDYPRPPVIASDARRVVVRCGAQVLADSTHALRVLETASPPTFYLPSADVAVALLICVEQRSFCEWKGEARYWSLAHDPRRTGVAWDYPCPTSPFEKLLEHFAFYPGRLECSVDGQRVRPQPGGFYAGWVTDEVVGPFKGEPGTGHW